MRAIGTTEMDARHWRRMYEDGVIERNTLRALNAAQEKQIAVLSIECQSNDEAAYDARQENKVIRALNAEALEMLEMYGWSYDEWKRESRCRSCGTVKDYPHKPDCKLNALLQKANKPHE